MVFPDLTHLQFYIICVELTTNSIGHLTSASLVMVTILNILKKILIKIKIHSIHVLSCLSKPVRNRALCFEYYTQRNN